MLAVLCLAYQIFLCLYIDILLHTLFFYISEIILYRTGL